MDQLRRELLMGKRVNLIHTLQPFLKSRLYIALMGAVFSALIAIHGKFLPAGRTGKGIQRFAP